MNNCSECNVKLNIDECINHQGKIVCGHCFVEMPKESYSFVNAPLTKEVNQAEAIIQLMQMAVDQEERIKVLEEKYDLLSTQFDSICG